MFHGTGGILIFVEVFFPVTHGNNRVRLLERISDRYLVLALAPTGENSKVGLFFHVTLGVNITINFFPSRNFVKTLRIAIRVLFRGFLLGLKPFFGT